MQGENLESARIEIGRDHAARRLSPLTQTKAAPTVILELTMRWATTKLLPWIIAGVLRRRNPQNGPLSSSLEVAAALLAEFLSYCAQPPDYSAFARRCPTKYAQFALTGHSSHFGFVRLQISCPWHFTSRYARVRASIVFGTSASIACCARR